MKRRLYWILYAMPTNLSLSNPNFFQPDVVVFGTGPLGLFSVQMARIMGAVNIVMVGLEEDVAVRFPIAKELGATAVVNGSTEDAVARCQKSAVKTIWGWSSNALVPISP